MAIPNARNETITSDFDIAYATKEGLDAGEELNGWDFATVMDWTGSYQNGDATNAYKQITDGATKPKVTDLNECDLKTQNLYVVVTRTKESRLSLTEGDDFLTETPRQLQGGLTPDFEIAFSLTQGNAKFLGAISFALAAVLAVFAF
jgi:hypothetical protein